MTSTLANDGGWPVLIALSTGKRTAGEWLVNLTERIEQQEWSPSDLLPAFGT
jgi:hypothetical protein